MWKEVTVAKLGLLSQHLLGKTGKSLETSVRTGLFNLEECLLGYNAM
jgi:hypothetical protein